MSTKIEVVEQKLSDGSCVYDVAVLSDDDALFFAAVSLNDAHELARKLTAAIETHTKAHGTP